MADKINAFAEGMYAYSQGRQSTGNPYTLHSKDWVRWNSGWTSGELFAQRAANAAQLEAVNARPLPEWVTK